MATTTERWDYQLARAAERAAERERREADYRALYTHSLRPGPSWSHGLYSHPPDLFGTTADGYPFRLYPLEREDETMYEVGISTGGRGTIYLTAINTNGDASDPVTADVVSYHWNVKKERLIDAHVRGISDHF